MKVLILALFLAACGTVKVPATNVETATDASLSTATQTTTETDTASAPPQAPTTQPRSVDVTESCSASASASVTVSGQGQTAASSNPAPDLSYGPNRMSWLDASRNAPPNFHLPSRGELVQLADTGIFTATEGVYWTASTATDPTYAWLYSPDSGFLGTNEKTQTFNVVYVSN